MSFKAKLNMNGKELTVLECYYSLSQDVDATGRPSSIARGGKITITIESTASTDFFEWMTNSFDRKEGSIIFYKRDNDQKLKELKFKEAYLIDYNEHFNSIGSQPLTETFTLSAKEIELGGGKHVNEWPV